MKSSVIIILFKILFLCHTIYGDVYQDNSSVISNVITKSERYRRHGIQAVSNNENYGQNEGHQTSNRNGRHNKLNQSRSGDERHDKINLGGGDVSEVSNNIKLGSKIKSRITKMTKNSNKNRESDLEIEKIRDVRSSNRDHFHDRPDTANDESRGLFGASGGISGGLGGNVGDASADTQFGIKFNGGIGRH